MAFILITNDDGVDSPALLPLARAIGKLAPVRVVVPEEERSWIGKAISRWQEVKVRHDERDGQPVTLVSGSPADCANLGVYSLFDERPELVVSGINLGLNAGSGFFLSSGTVGAAMEGWIAGLPALAFSIGMPKNDKSWKVDADSPAWRQTWERAAALAADVVASVREIGFPDGVDLLNVNFDVAASIDTPREITRMAHLGYQKLFVPVSEGEGQGQDKGEGQGQGRYVHDFGGGLSVGASLDGTDIASVREGRVSITPVRLLSSPELPDALRRALEHKRSD